MARNGSPGRAADQLSALEAAEFSQPDELVVATEHLPFLRDQLGVGIREREIVSNDWLSLSKVPLNPGEAVRVLRQKVAAEPSGERIRDGFWDRRGARYPRLPQARPDADDGLAEVLASLRALAITRHGGWMPTIGRNRLVSRARTTGGGKVGAAREISVGGAGAPLAISGKAAAARPSRRPQGPGAGVRVGLVDTGIWPNSWLDGGWTAGPGDVLDSARVYDYVAGHATFVTGLILQRAPSATVELRGVLDPNGEALAWDVAEAMVELGRSGIDVLNLSIVCYTADGQPPLVLSRARERIDPGVVVVAAAGNHAADPGGLAVDGRGDLVLQFAQLPAWPAALDDVVAVGALTSEGGRAPFSPAQPWVDVEVPGVDLVSTYLAKAGPPEGPVLEALWARWTGTSFAGAVVSGRIAAGTTPGQTSAGDSLRVQLVGEQRPRRLSDAGS